MRNPPESKLVASAFLVLLACTAVEEDPRTTCAADEDCAPGAVCTESRCDPVESIALTAPSLPRATAGVAYSAQLPITGGAAPYVFAILQRPPALSWMRIDAATGALSGTPTLASEAPIALQVSVIDRSRQQATRSYELVVGSCVDGTSVACFSPTAPGTCSRGVAICTDGRPGACVTESPSEEVGHCGEEGGICGVCGEGANRCEAGVCACGAGPACGAGEICCGVGLNASCRDAESDPANCGSCGNQCSAGINAVPQCRFGSCVATTTCASGFGACDPSRPNDCATATSSSVDHCGSCGNRCDLTRSDACEDGICVCGEGAGSCAFSETCCGAGSGLNVSCTDTDRGIRVPGGIARCGDCSAGLCTDPAGPGQATCVDGACGAQCDSGPSGVWRDCDGPREVNPPRTCDVNLLEDVNNCGACGRVCQGPSNGNGSPVCVNGECSVVCANRFNACPTDSGQIECRDQTSANSCGTSCNPPIAVNKTPPQVIRNTAQSKASCASPQLDSTGSLTAYCEYSTPSESCIYAVDCNTDFGNCGTRDLIDGCETDLRISNENCGACGHRCSDNVTAHATSMGCEQGTCAAASCEPGWARCDGSLQCDTATNVSDVNNCGSCNTCPPPPSGKGTAICNGATCSFVCVQGYQLCNGDCVSNDDPSHCGSCGRICETFTDPETGEAQYCSAGKCCQTTCVEGRTPPCRTQCQ